MRLFLTSALAAGCLLAQSGIAPGRASLTAVAISDGGGREPGLLPRVDYPELRRYLGLTDTQVDALADVQKSKSEAEGAIHRQIAERYRELNQLLREGSNDANRIGQLMVEINNLRRQLPLPAGPYRDAALKVLNDDQKARLPALEQALRLAPAAWQAASLVLIDQPRDEMRIQPFPYPIATPELDGQAVTLPAPIEVAH